MSGVWLTSLFVGACVDVFTRYSVCRMYLQYLQYITSTFALRQYIYWEHYVSQIRLAAPTRPALTPINLVE